MAKQKAVTRRYADYSPELKGEAVALALTYGYTKAASLMRSLHPVECDHLDHSLVWRWTKAVIDTEAFNEMHQTRIETFKAGLIDIGIKATQIFAELLDDPRQDRKIVAGIVLDKPLAMLRADAQAKAQPAAAGNIQIVIQSQSQSQVLAVNQEPKGENQGTLTSPDPVS